jgi:hypothetical protein
MSAGDGSALFPSVHKSSRARSVPRSGIKIEFAEPDVDDVFMRRAILVKQKELARSVESMLDRMVMLNV